MRGPIGSKLEVTIGRTNEEPFDVTIKRDIIKITSVRSRLEKDVGYLRITNFSEQTNKSTMLQNIRVNAIRICNLNTFKFFIICLLFLISSLFFLIFFGSVFKLALTNFFRNPKLF